MKKSVCVTLTRAPYGRIHLSEGLRAAAGIAAGFDHHDVSILFIEDAVYAARDTVDREALNMQSHLSDLESNDSTLLVDRSGLNARNIDPETITDDIEIASETEITRTIRTADEVLTF